MTRPLLLVVALLLAVFALAVVEPLRIPAASASSCCERSGLESKAIHSVHDRPGGLGREYVVANLVDGPIEVRCKLVDVQNVRSLQALPRKLVLAARERRPITQLQAVDPSKIARAGVACDAIVGDPHARPLEARAYGFPLPAGTRYSLDQGFGGRFSHDTDDARHALDFGVPEGTPVLAARTGTVMQLEDDFRISGTDAKRFGDRANYVRVLHDDGSMAVYAHLAPDSLLLRPGTKVVTGQQLGRSGNTGYSTGPHLHFSVQRNAGMALHSVSFSVLGVDHRLARR